ncbi:helix-turn-helix domain-containing protein [Sporosarcina sp. resist]|uniref:helix-turn-helix domain-containing protein n=1 Tax=Sporosarcina sp. resist TaxID=2762563 RepID=UPI00164E7707|nr:helix-turn-helix domain-containing protein [Sporosarcina sp. resist]QNK87789.1 helix-turn-helix domain-containing protein [Sporosarcina sp. resist]
MNFGMALKATRKAVKLTQEQMSPLVQISRSTISKLERGEMSLQSDDLMRWLHVVTSRLQVQNTTPIEMGVVLVNGVDVVALTQTLTQFLGGFISFLF